MKRIEYMLTQEIEKTNEDMIDCCTMFETEAEYAAYIKGLEFALAEVRTIPNIPKADVLMEIYSTLDEWANVVEEIGNECAYTDSFLDKLPKIIKRLTKI